MSGDVRFTRRRCGGLEGLRALAREHGGRNEEPEPRRRGFGAGTVRDVSRQIAQVNIGQPLEPLDSPLLAEFVALLDPINELADASPGFVWRLQGDGGNATAIEVLDDDRLIVNMSVWNSIDELADFAYRSAHVAVMRRRREWFERLRVYMALWWVPSGHIPTVAEAEDRLEHLREHGPSAYAFTFSRRFDPDSGQVADSFDDLTCPA